MRIVLEIIEGVAAGRKKALRAPLALVVGRGEAADWALPEDTALSSRHFEISVNQDGCFLTDLDSTNGTTVDGERISRQQLVDGNKIGAGTTVFQVSITQRAPIATLISGLEPTAIQWDTDRTDDSSRDLPVANSTAEKVGERIGSFQITPSSSRPFTGAVIEVVSEHALGRKSILRSGQSITVGRTEQADFVISDPQLSATHFRLSDERAGWLLTDLNSTAGTSVNGTKVSTTLLKTGDRVVAGQTHFVVTIGESAPLGGKTDGSLPPFQDGVRDEDPLVRRAAILAAAWSAEPWLLDFCRQCARQPSPDNKDALEMMAILGLPTDLELVRKLGKHADLGSRRFDWLASFAHPAVVADLLEAISGTDLPNAIAAANAFTRITGLEITSGQRATLPPDRDDDEFDQEFVADVPLPDAAKAERLWQPLSQRFTSTTCLRRGIELSGMPPAEILHKLDMRSRWEVCLRGKFEGKWQGRPFELERFSFDELLQVQG